MLQRRRRRRGVVKQGLPLVVQFEFVTWVLLEWSEWFDRNVSCYFSKGAEFQINWLQWVCIINWTRSFEFKRFATNSMVTTCRHPPGQPLPYSAVTVVYHLWPRALILSSNRDFSQIRWERREREMPTRPCFVAEQKVWRCDGSRGWAEGAVAQNTSRYSMTRWCQSALESVHGNVSLQRPKVPDPEANSGMHCRVSICWRCFRLQEKSIVHI